MRKLHADQSVWLLGLSARIELRCTRLPATAQIVNIVLTARSESRSPARITGNGQHREATTAYDCSCPEQHR